MQLAKTPKAKIVKGLAPNTKDEIQKSSSRLCTALAGRGLRAAWVKSFETGYEEFWRQVKGVHQKGKRQVLRVEKCN